MKILPDVDRSRRRDFEYEIRRFRSVSFAREAPDEPKRLDFIYKSTISQLVDKLIKLPDQFEGPTRDFFETERTRGRGNRGRKGTHTREGTNILAAAKTDEGDHHAKFRRIIRRST